MGNSGARGEFNFTSPIAVCKYRRLPCECRLLDWAKARARLRLEGGNITSISRLPPYAVVADAGVRDTCGRVESHSITVIAL
jgi:hypothetical protein